MSGLVKEQKEDREERRRQMMKLWKERRESIKEVLTKDQYIQYLENSQAQDRKGPGERHFKRRGTKHKDFRKDAPDKRKKITFFKPVRKFYRIFLMQLRHFR